MVISLNPTLEEFALIGPGLTARCAWVKEGIFSIYVRRGYRSLEGLRRSTLDIASIESLKPGSGKLDELFTKAERLTQQGGFDCTFVECVHNRRLGDWLLRRGYTLDSRLAEAGNHHYYRMVGSD